MPYLIHLRRRLAHTVRNASSSLQARFELTLNTLRAHVERPTGTKCSPVAIIVITRLAAVARQTATTVSTGVRQD